MIRIVIADDHHLVRQGLRALLEKHPELSVVGEAQDGLEALAVTDQLHPQVLLLDINMPLLNGIEVAKRVREEIPETRVVILSMYSDESLVKKAFRNGARGYLLKKSIIQDLVAAIQAASRGELYLSPTIAETMDTSFLYHPAQEDAPDGFEQLTARERQICQLVAEGHTNSAVARQLNISVKTVEKHRARLMEKLGVRDVSSLVREAIRHGVVFLER
jgi:DNA-binding NarL/FixJ family response regulator